MNNGINVPDMDLYMKRYIKKLFTIECFLNKITFNGRGNTINLKHSVILHCFAGNCFNLLLIVCLRSSISLVSMVRKFESVQTNKDDEKILIYKKKIQDYISTFKFLCNRNPNNWF